MAASMRAQPPLYCLQVEDDSVPVAVQGTADRSSESVSGLSGRERIGRISFRVIERRVRERKRLAAVAVAGGTPSEGMPLRV